MAQWIAEAHFLLTLQAGLNTFTESLKNKLTLKNQPQFVGTATAIFWLFVS